MLSFAALSINRFYDRAEARTGDARQPHGDPARALRSGGERRIERARHLCAEQAVSLRGDAAQARSASRPKAGG